MGENTAQHAANQMKIGRYTVEARLGEGGMAETWLCRLHGAKGFSKRVVIKTLKPECRDADYQTMFADEARVGSRLDHPNIPRILEFGEITGVPYLVQEYVEGPSVFQILQRQKLRRYFDIRLGCRIVADVALALDHAYSATDEDGRALHVIHRDVSPSNVMVSRKGLAKLIDFGVAMFEDRETRTQTGVLKGKLRYMAPEVLLRDQVSHKSDLYSLGIMLYALVVGEPAWNGAEEVADRLRGHVEKPSVRRSDVPPEIDRIVMKCLAIDPTGRYPTGRALAEDLTAYLHSSGDPVSDHWVAEQLNELFPDGPRDWMAGHDITFTAAALPTRQVRTRAPPWGVVLVGTAGLATAMVGLFVAVAVGSWYISQLSLQPTVLANIPPTPAPTMAEDQQDAAGELLDAAEQALAKQEVAEAANHLRAVSALQLSDASLLSRRERLQSELQVTTRVKATRELIAVDPSLALERTLTLDNEYPGQAEVSRLLTDVRLALAREEKQERRVVTVVVPSPASVSSSQLPEPRVIERPEAVPDGLLDVFGPTPANVETKETALKDPFEQQSPEGVQR